jgi:hypothetical protein
MLNQNLFFFQIKILNQLAYMYFLVPKRMQLLLLEKSSNFKFDKINAKTVTFTSPNIFSMNLYYAINLLLFILYYNTNVSIFLYN